MESTACLELKIAGWDYMILHAYRICMHAFFNVGSLQKMDTGAAARALNPKH